MPENTIPAMLKAIDLGVTTLEMDVVVSKDHKVVVSHDVYFNGMITTAPNGKFLTNEEAGKHQLYSMPYDSIKKYDVGLKLHPFFPRQEKMRVTKPLLQDLLMATEAYALNQRKNIRYNIEIKSDPVNDGKKHPPIDKFVDLVMSNINSKGLKSRTTIQSFDMRALKEMHKSYPRISTALLIEDFDHRSFREQMNKLDFKPSIYSPHFSLVNADLVEQCHKQNMKIIPWTVNALEEIRRLKTLGVDGIISDYPDLFLQL